MLAYDISYITLIGAKPVRIRFNKVNEFVRFYDGSRYLVLFGDEKYDFIYNRIKLFIRVKVGPISYLIFYQKLKLILIIIYL